MNNNDSEGTVDPDNPTEAAVDDSGAESGRKKGGGKKSPGGQHQKPTKLPSCSLPSNMVPTFYVGGGNGVALVEGSLVNLGWKRITDKFDERFRLKWVECKSRINYGTFREGEQLVNHLPNAHLLTNKLGLLNSLKEYERVTLSTKGRLPRLKMSDFHPETYKLDEKTDRELFLETYKEGEMWICKPVGMNQGKGIFLIRSREEIQKVLEEREQKKQLPQKPGGKGLMNRIVQRYIMNPLLLDGRKFDIRAYMLVASTTPYLILYHKGYVRLSCNKYDGNDSNLVTHLTNQFIQKKDPAYKELKEETAWNMDRFNEYVNEEIRPNCPVEIEEDWVYNTLTKQMQKIMIHCFNSVKHKLQSRMGYFDLFGLDYMVDTNMKVSLIEVNVNPALHLNCEALKEVIPGVVQESLYLAIECFEKARKSQPLLPLQSLKNFIILYCGSHPTNVLVPRQSRSVSPVKADSASAAEKPKPGALAKAPPTRRVLTQSTPLFTTASSQRRSSEKSDASGVTFSASGKSGGSSAHQNVPSARLTKRLTINLLPSGPQVKPAVATASTMTEPEHNTSNNKPVETAEVDDQSEVIISLNADQSEPAPSAAADQSESTNLLPPIPMATSVSPPQQPTQPKHVDTLAKTTDSINLATSTLGKINFSLNQVGLTDSLLEEVRLKMTHANQSPPSSRSPPSAKSSREKLHQERGS